MLWHLFALGGMVTSAMKRVKNCVKPVRKSVAGRTPIQRGAVHRQPSLISVNIDSFSFYKQRGICRFCPSFRIKIRFSTTVFSRFSCNTNPLPHIFSLVRTACTEIRHVVCPMLIIKNPKPMHHPGSYMVPFGRLQIRNHLLSFPGSQFAVNAILPPGTH